MEAEHAVVCLLQAAVVYVHLIGCAADHLTLSHQRLIGQELRSRASMPRDGQRLLLGKVDFLHLQQKRNIRRKTGARVSPAETWYEVARRQKVVWWLTVLIFMCPMPRRVCSLRADWLGDSKWTEGHEGFYLNFNTVTWVHRDAVSALQRWDGRCWRRIRGLNNVVHCRQSCIALHCGCRDQANRWQDR